MTEEQDHDAARTEVGVGPWVGTPPDDDRYDPVLLAEGDRRNVVDRYRYWTVEAIRADLDTRRHPVHVAIENWAHDLNIGSVVRTANAMNVAAVHVVGRRRWNRRGAMVTDRYLHVQHHATVEDLLGWAATAGPGGGRLPVHGIDNLPGSVPLESADLPEHVLLLFGQEGPGPVRAGAGRGGRRPCRSPSTGRPARSTRGSPPGSPCTPGSAAGPGPRRIDHGATDL